MFPERSEQIINICEKSTLFMANLPLIEEKCIDTQLDFGKVLAVTNN